MISDRVNEDGLRSDERGVALSIYAYWDRLALAAVLLLAAVLDFYGLSREGFGNTYYAAAVKSMTESRHNFLFNSFDPGGFVSIDKPPLGFWFQVASVKVFGFNGVALMLPQALAGVLSVALLYYLVSRVFGKPAGLLAALVLALTPISVVTSRNNIIDGTLVLVVLLGAWAVSRAVETGKLRWLLLCALFVGLGFNVKMLEAYLVVPAFGLTYLVGARIGWGKRLAHLALATVVLLAVSLSWVLAVDGTPAGQRPWVGSTTTNSELDLAVGYNGLQRLTGNVFGRGGRGPAPARTTPAGSTTRATTGGPPGGFSAGETGAAGPLRLFNSQLGGQISWLLPLAVIGFFVAAWQTRRRLWPFDERQSALVMWGMWLLTTAVFFSIAGFFHVYYLVMMAPAIAALAGIGVVSLWQEYREPGSRIWWLLPLSLLAVAAVQAHLLADYPAWSRWLVPLIIGLCVVVALGLVFARLRPQVAARWAVPALLLGIVAVLSAPAAWAADSVQSANTGLTPRAGPTSSTVGGFGAFRGGRGFGGFPGTLGRGGGFRPPAGGFAPPGGFFRFRNGGGGFDRGTQVDKNLLQYLERHQGTAKFLFATDNANTAEPYILATGKPVMAMGGFLGSDPILTPAKVAALVRTGTVRYFLLGGGRDFRPGGSFLSELPAQVRERLQRGGGFGGRFGENNAVTTWVQQHCSVVSPATYSSISTTTDGGFGGQQLYSCTSR